MASETPFLRAILPLLPSDFAKKVRTLCSSTSDSSAEYVLDTLIRFICGAGHATNAPTDTRAQWVEKQQEVYKILRSMTQPGSTTSKRGREDDLEPASKSPKRQRSSDEDAPAQTDEGALYTLHSISTTSPIRKKVDITIHETYLRFTHPTTHAVESTVAISALTRAFLLPTRGKSKAHWTVVILSSDTPESTKAPPSSVQSGQQQVIFGVDAVTTSAWSSTTHSSPSAKPDVLPKGSPTRPSLLAFLSRLGIRVIEPTPDVFKSACTGITSGVSASEAGIPGIEAYRGAKPGSLWFTKEGVLWGESKPCEFWAVEDLIGKSEGLRVAASGRSCSVVLTRKSGEEIGEDEEDVGVETQLGLIDARERPGIEEWVRGHRHLFGRKRKAEGAVTVGQIEDDEDDEDEDFEMESDDGISDGSASPSSSDEEGEDGEGEVEAEGSDDAEASEEELEEELREKNHPLMQPGAMPRMSRAVIDMVVGMVEEDMLGSAAGTAVDHQGEDELEEDELDD